MLILPQPTPTADSTKNYSLPDISLASCTGKIDLIGLTDGKELMASHILWQNADATVTLIDVPRSIASAQSTSEHSWEKVLLSTEPLQQPFPLNEPKSPSARAKLSLNTVSESLHREYNLALKSAMDQIHTAHGGPWCLSRPWTQDQTRDGRKRKHENMSAADWSEQLAHMPSKTFHASQAGEYITLDNDDQRASHGQGACSASYTKHCGGDLAQLYYLPPNASCYLGDCSEAGAFHHAVRLQAKIQCTSACFDCVILDPPWPNRSVRRTHKTAGSTYSTVPTLRDTIKLLIDMELEELLAMDCLVGMWITNKPAIRDLSLRDGGIFDRWGLDCIEEWLWLKTTEHGEPVMSIESLWRKPYEVLLLGRKRKKPGGQNTSADEAISVKRRVIVGVPDMHSRKPCLKSLLEPLLSDPNSYRALEIFARHLVAGWWSWGNECIKFNSEAYWKKEGESTKSAQ